MRSPSSCTILISVLDLEDVGENPLISELDFDAGLAKNLISAAEEEARALASAAKRSQAESVLEKETKQTEKEQEAASNSIDNGS